MSRRTGEVCDPATLALVEALLDEHVNSHHLAVRKTRKQLHDRVVAVLMTPVSVVTRVPELDV